MKNFDAIVIGAGHAGVEAARSLAVRNFSTALVTLDTSKVGAMSCNPAIGGVAKSHLVFEIDALGGWMGACADENSIQSRRLNGNKGPAVRSTRVQCDKEKYSQTMTRWVNSLPNLCLVNAEAKALVFEGRKIAGLELADGSRISSRVVIVTAGTFMRGLMFCGDDRKVGGRYGDKASDFLTQSILESGHQIFRLKTGTPARLKASTINFSKASEQWGDPEKRRFSWHINERALPQLSCYMVYTNSHTHDIIRENFSKSPLFSGEIQGVGPRYCPSIEDKVKRFAERDRHQIFLEPESLDGDSIYPNGLSTSLPADVQLSFLRSIPGLESCELIRPGYAVEYDSIDPRDLNFDFSSRFTEGLYFAGQVNRTSGYEEAAAQGLWAGLNAGRFLQGQPSLSPRRERSYLETLVSDLVTKGTEEPYRLFTSRSEFRLLLREDNAADRLIALGRENGVVSDPQMRAYDKLRADTVEAKERLCNSRIRLDANRVISLYEYLRRPEIRWEDLSSDYALVASDAALERIEIETKYSGYLLKQESELRQLESMRNWDLDPSLSLRGNSTISHEALEKYEKHKPKNVWELSQISGITPAAVLAIAKGAGRRNVSRETDFQG